MEINEQVTNLMHGQIFTALQNCTDSTCRKEWENGSPYRPSEKACTSSIHSSTVGCPLVFVGYIIDTKKYRI
jgi:hypothetical protein